MAGHALQPSSWDSAALDTMHVARRCAPGCGHLAFLTHVHTMLTVVHHAGQHEQQLLLHKLDAVLQCAVCLILCHDTNLTAARSMRTGG
jgi:hypothetical protein